MTDQAPTVTGTIAWLPPLGVVALEHIIALRPGDWLHCDMDLDEYRVIMICPNCQTMIGCADLSVTERIYPWMQKGWMYNAEIIGKGENVTTYTLARFEPIPPIEKIAQRSAKEKIDA